MSETVTQPSPVATAEPGSDPAAGAAGPAVPPGYVPASEVEKAREEVRRTVQSEYDRRLHAEVEKLKNAPAPPTPAASGSDPVIDRESILRDVYGAHLMSQAAVALKSEFPDADPTLFAPEKLSQFGSPEAFRFAVEDSHKRVAAILAERTAAVEAKVREEMAAKFGDGGAGSAGSPPVPGADPTPQQLAAMTVAEMDALEAKNPGVVNRVLRGASA